MLVLLFGIHSAVDFDLDALGSADNARFRAEKPSMLGSSLLQAASFTINCRSLPLHYLLEKLKLNLKRSQIKLI